MVRFLEGYKWDCIARIYPKMYLSRPQVCVSGPKVVLSGLKIGLRGRRVGINRLSEDPGKISWSNKSFMIHKSVNKLIRKYNEIELTVMITVLHVKVI